MKVVTEHADIKYSLQPHGLRSKLLFAFFAFVVAFGGALAVAAPAQADPTDPPGTCYVAVTASPQPSPSPSVPVTTPSPTPCPTTPPPVTTTTTVTAPPVTTTITAPPVTTKITVTVTKQQIITVDQTQTKTETVTITPSESPSLTSTPQRTPDPTLSPVSGDGGSLSRWGLVTVGVLGLGLAGLGLVGIVRGRRQSTGRHHVDNTETTVIPVVPGSKDDHDVTDYGHGDYDPALGGHAGESYNDETMQIRPVEPDSSEDTDTKPLPSVQ